MNLVMNNCVIGRGYRVLDSNIAFLPMPQQVAAAPALPARMDAPATLGQPVPMLAIYRPPQPVPESGRWIRESEHAAVFFGCMVPIARLTLAEPGFERYAVRCGGDGGEESLKVNCENGRCSAQR
ncbi:MAG: hypothetical protein ABI887_09600 [Burkholderiales bacterium]